MAEQPTSVPQPENAPVAKHYWSKAQKCRKALFKELESLREDKDVSSLARYDKLEKLIAENRLACVQTIFLNYEYSVKEGVEDALWQAHSLVNAEYRNALERVRNVPRLAVFKNKLERSYLEFLKVSQRFYEGFIQRLATIYDVPELRLASKRIDSKELAEKNPVRDVPETARRSLILSCSMTLIHIGDLVRYRCQARHHKKPNYRSALAYYSLAHDLNPSSGHAHHQMAIVHLDEKKHFDIVYHFFMSLAVTQPHPRALRNLESEFKSLIASSGVPTSTSRRSGPPNPHEPFMNWFVRLHAFFYQGEKFSQQEELENEVLHRLDMSLKAPDAEAMLMKMVLINTAAYYVAKTKLSAQGTGPAARYTAVLLRFNILFFRTLVRALSKELRVLQEMRAEWEESKERDAPTATEERPKATSTQLMLLPLVRLYASWLVGYRSDVGATTAEDTKPAVEELGETFAACLTMLVDAYATDDLKIAPHLLPEDHMALGLLPLNSPDIPDSCRLSYDQEKRREKPVSDLYTDRRSDGFADSLARVLDIMYCGYFLSEDKTLPFSLNESNLEFTYGTEHPASQLVTTPRMQNPNLNHTTKAQEARPATRDEHRSPRAGRSGEAHAVPAGRESLSGRGTAHAAPISPARNLGSASTGPVSQALDSLVSGEAPARSTTSQDGTDYDFTENTAVMNMVHEFLAPPVARRNQSQGRSSQAHEDSSYGMNSVTANEVFGGLSARNTPTLGSPSAFPGLPWDMVYTPTPNRSMAERSPSTSSAYLSAAAKLSSMTNASSDPSNRQGQAAASFLAAPSPTVQQYPQYTTAYSADDLLNAHRAQLLQAFGGRASGSRPTSQDYTASGQDSGRSFPAPSATGSQEPVPRNVAPQNGYVASPSTSAFSHPSSILQGTPYDGHVNPYAVPTHSAYDGVDYPSRNNAFAYDPTVTDEAYLSSHGGQGFAFASRDQKEAQRRVL